jgi:bacilysin biosynthesis protein BacA
MKDNYFFYKFEKQFNDFKLMMKKHKVFKIGTLGPNGTSSENALKYLIKNIKNEYNEFEVCLSNNFPKLYELLEEGKLDFVLVPTAYENICDFFLELQF